jgi:hypothetical protein
VAPAKKLRLETLIHVFIKMSVPIVRELFRGLETTLHERLTIIEELLRKPLGGDGSIEQSMQIQRPDPAVLDRIAKVEAHNVRLAESFAMLIDTLNGLTEEISHIRNSMRVLEASHTANVPVAEEVEQEIAHREAVSAPELAEAEAAEAEEEEEVEEEVVEEEGDEEEAEEEEQELELESFVYKRNGKTYYRDPENNVYQDDEDGNLIDTPIGVWNETTQRIHPLAK